MPDITKLVKAFDAFAEKLKSISGLEVEALTEDPSSDSEIAEVEKALALKVPADLRAFWKAGARNVRINSAGDGRVLGAVRFVSARGAMSQIKTAKSILGGKYPPGDPLTSRWLKSGIPLHEEENYCLVDASKAGEGRVYQMRFDGDPLEVPVAPDFSSMFEQWLASGCFSYGNADSAVFSEYWKKVKSLAPGGIEPKKNGWLQHWGRFYENPKFP